MTLKSCEQRRLGCEQQIYRKFESVKDFTDKLNTVAVKNFGYDIGEVNFKPGRINAYLSGNCDLSFKLMKILGFTLGVSDLREIDELYTAPRIRGRGEAWIGSMGSRAADINTYYR